MAEQAEMDGSLARLEAALTAAIGALEQAEAAPDHSPDVKRLEGELSEARQKIATLEQLDRDREATLDGALTRAKAAEKKAAEDKPVKSSPSTSSGGDTAALEAEVAELRAARAQDLAEMKALLAELEPMLETSNA